MLEMKIHSHIDGVHIEASNRLDTLWIEGHDWNANMGAVLFINKAQARQIIGVLDSYLQKYPEKVQEPVDSPTDGH